MTLQWHLFICIKKMRLKVKSESIAVNYEKCYRRGTTLLKCQLQHFSELTATRLDLVSSFDDLPLLGDTRARAFWSRVLRYLFQCLLPWQQYRETVDETIGIDQQ